MTTVEATLLDEILPEFDVAARYSIKIRATPDAIFQIIQKGIPTGTLTRFLMMLRRIPRIFRHAESVDYSFYKLKQSQGREIVIGIVGQFWKPVSNNVVINGLEEFLSFQKNGFCKAAVNLQIIPQGDGVCKLVTETRVFSYGYAKDRFGTYWQLIKPFSGMIRKEILRKIKKQAESVSENPARHSSS